MFKYELGVELQDIVTGFKGFAMARVSYLTGGNQYGLRCRMKEGATEPPDVHYIDEIRLVPTGERVSLPALMDSSSGVKKLV